MLHDDASRVHELLDAFECRVAVRNVVIRQCLTLQLLSRRERALRCLLVDVKRCVLMRVFAVTHSLHKTSSVQDAFAKRVVVQRFRQVPGDGCVVTGRVCISLCCQASTILERQLIFLQRFENALIVVRVDNDGDAIVIFRCGADHRRPTDIDILDSVVNRGVLASDRLFERIEIHSQQVDGLDAVLGHYGFVSAAATQQSTMNRWMQRLHTPVHNFRKPGLLGDLNDIDARFAQCAAGTTG